MDPATLAIILGATLATSAGNMYINRKNLQYANEANSESIALANTAHQREVRDLEAAGLNPILSATGSGSPVPQLKVPDQDNPLANVQNSANSLAAAANGLTKANVSGAISEAQLAGLESDLAKNTYASNVAAINSANREASTAADLQYIENLAKLSAFSHFDLDNVGLYDNKNFRNLEKAYRRAIDSKSFYGNRIMNFLPYALQGSQAFGTTMNGINSAAGAAGRFKFLFRK